MPGPCNRWILKTLVKVPYIRYGGWEKCSNLVSKPSSSLFIYLFLFLFYYYSYWEKGMILYIFLAFSLWPEPNFMVLSPCLTHGSTFETLVMSLKMKFLWLLNLISLQWKVSCLDPNSAFLITYLHGLNRIQYEKKID